MIAAVALLRAVGIGNGRPPPVTVEQHGLRIHVVIEKGALGK